MKKPRPTWIAKLSILVCLVLLAAASARAKSYRVEQISVDAVVEPDGTLQVEEDIRYQFKGSYSFAFREILIKAGETLSDVRVSENGVAYRGSREESPGTYSVSEDDGRVKITWHFKARNETRTFTLSYRMLGVAKRYPDTAELYYQFVGDRWDQPIGRAEATVRFRSPVDPGSLRAWAHGPLHGIVQLPGDGTVYYEVAPLPRRTFWEGRVLFPTFAAPNARLASTEPALDRILAQERAWAEEANRRREAAAAARARQRELAKLLLPVSVLAALAGVLVWTFLYLKKGKPYPPQRTFPPGQPPGDLHPALASYLMNRDVGGSAIAATLIDLARRGFLRIKEEEREKPGWFGTKKVIDYHLELTGKPLQEAEAFERELVEFAMAQAGDGQGLWMSQFKKVSSKKASRFLKWFKQWKKQVKEQGKEFFEPYSGSALTLNLVVGVAVLGFGIISIVITDSPVGVPAIIAGGLQALGSLALTRRTPEGESLYRAWKEFRSHIQSIAKGLGPVSLKSDDWGRYLVASIVLGLHRDLSKKLDEVTDPDLVHAMGWYVPHASDGSRGLAGFGDSIGTMVSAMGSTVSSATGAGGGASGGGGGGSGGGGGGAG